MDGKLGFSGGAWGRWLARVGRAAVVLMICGGTWWPCGLAAGQEDTGEAGATGEVYESTEAADWFPEARRRNAEESRETLRFALRGGAVVLLVLVGVLCWKFLLDAGHSGSGERADPRAVLAGELEDAKLAHAARRMEREYRIREQRRAKGD